MKHTLARVARRSRRAAVLAGITTAAIVGLAACSGGSPEPVDGGGIGTAENPVEIHMITNEAFANAWQDQMVPEFNKHYPHIKLVIDGVPYTELLAKSLLDATSTEPTYDLLVADEPWIPQLAESGALLDLKSDEAAKWTADDYDWDDFNSAPLAAGEWNGAQYGVPLRSNLLMMFVNYDLYKKAGVPAPTSELTWDEYLDQASDLVQDTDGDGKVDAWAIDTYFMREPLTPTIWQTILNSNGGQLIDENNKVAFNNKLGVEALQTHMDLLEFAPPGGVSHGFDESLASFRAGQVATSFQWGSVFKGNVVDPNTTTLNPEIAGIQVMPVGSESAGAHRGVWVGGVSPKSDKQEAAWTMLQWLSSTEGELWSANTLGVFPARSSTLATTPEQEWLAPVFAALQEGYAAAEEGKMWRPRLANSDAVQQVLADETSRAMAGEISAKEAIQNMADKIEKLLK